MVSVAIDIFYNIFFSIMVEVPTIGFKCSILTCADKFLFDCKRGHCQRAISSTCKLSSCIHLLVKAIEKIFAENIGDACNASENVFVF